MRAAFVCMCMYEYPSLFGRQEFTVDLYFITQLDHGNPLHNVAGLLIYEAELEDGRDL